MKDELISNESLLFIMDQLHEAVHITDKDGYVVYANPAAEKLEHVPLREMIGRNLTKIYSYSDYENGFKPPALDVLETGISRLNENCEYYSANGEIVNSIVSNYYYQGKDKENPCICSVSENITDMKERLIKYGGVENKKTVRLQKKLMKNGTSFIFDDIIGESPVIKNAIEMSKRFAVKKMPILLYGETGTGKEMFAQSIHNASSAMHYDFVPVNCAAIPENLLESILFGTVKGAFTGAITKEGLFEKAENGTVFLDEINSMPMVLQAKLLRALQEKEVQRIGSNERIKINCRIISATNKHPMNAISSGELREDLFYRISTGMIFIPPLRERGGDITLLARYFMEKSSEELGHHVFHMSNDLTELFSKYSWPGNIRELANVIESSVNMISVGDIMLMTQHLPQYMKNRLQQDILIKTAMEKSDDFVEIGNDLPLMKGNGMKETVDLFEQHLITDALKKTKGSIRKSADLLKITRQGLEKKLKKYRIDAKKYRPKSE